MWEIIPFKKYAGFISVQLLASSLSQRLAAEAVQQCSSSSAACRAEVTPIERERGGRGAWSRDRVALKALR